MTHAMNPHGTRVVQHANGEWQLLRDNVPYWIKGAGGVVKMARAKELGANSVRTWTVNDLGTVLDEAHSHGMTVCAGLFVKKAATNKEWYSSDKRKAERAAKVHEYLEVVKQYSGHPALLLWAVGNEAQSEGCSGFTPLYTFINDVARAIKEVDALHAVTTVTTSPTEEIASQLNAHCPDIDIWGVNVYGPLLPKLPAKMREVGWHRCYCVTEYGPKNHWQAKQSTWGAKLEPTSSEKAVMYRAAYEAMAGDRLQCCGGYAFKWGGKVQVTPTWICLLNQYEYTLSAKGGTLAGLEETPAVVELGRCWSGKAPTAHAPSVTGITLGGQGPEASVVVPCGQPVGAQCSATHPDGVAMQFLWMVLPELGAKGPDTEGISWAPDQVAPIPGCIAEADALGHVAVTPPTKPGDYRLFVWASDGRGFIGTANLPFQAVAPHSHLQSQSHHEAGHRRCKDCVIL